MKRYFAGLLIPFAISVVTMGQSSANAASASAMNGPDAHNICRIFFAVPKPGSEMQLETARKKHFQFHKQQGDTWTWNTWTIQTGEHTGTMVTSTCGHSWKDFDDWEKKMGKADTADALAGMGPLEAKTWNSFYEMRADMGNEPAGQAPSAMDSVTIIELHPLAAKDFSDAAIKIKDAFEKQPNNPKNSTWLQLVNGGDGPTFVHLSGHQGFADFADTGKPMLDVVTEAYGKDGADAIYKTLHNSIAHVSTEVAVYRPDLSYPGK